MRTPVEIRRLVASELPAYKALRDAVLAAHADAFTSDAAVARQQSAESYFGRLGIDRPEGGHFTLAAWHDDDLVGAISAEREARTKARHVGHLAGVMVRDDCAGQGIGRALLDATIRAARRVEGLEMLTLNVTATNLAAVHLYETAGFVRYARLPRAIRVDGRYLTKDQMVLVL